MRQTIAALAASALLFGSTPAMAGGYGHHGHHGHGHHDDAAGYIVGGLLGGLVLGSLLTRAATPPPRYYAQPSYYAPPQPALGGCRPTTGTGYLNGRPAQFGGTMCYDRYGNAYVIRGSEHFIGYLR